MKRTHRLQAVSVSVLSIIVNVLLSALKLALGFASNSIALITDAIHSASDLITSLAVVFSVRLSGKPADGKHPFGHGRAEDIGGLFVSFFLGLVGIGFLAESLKRLIWPQDVTVTVLFILTVLLAAIIKCVLAAYTYYVARKINSALLYADASHHISDAVTSIAVCVGLYLIQRGLLFIDSILAIVVAFIIIFWAVRMARGFIDSLMGKGPSGELIAQIKEIALSFPPVEGAHDIIVHSYGPRRIISLHIVVDSSLTLAAAHQVADSIEKTVYRRKLGGCVVHVDVQKEPKMHNESDIEKAVQELVRAYSRVRAFHSLDVVSTEDATIVSFHLLFDHQIPLHVAHAISHDVSRKLKERFGFSRVDIHVEPYEEGRSK